jgi:para-nitrobenzyl esterase
VTEIVEVTGGRLAGRRQGSMRVFLGVPYAASTGGAGRFAPPRPREPWSGVRAALDFGPACPQPPIRDNIVISPDVEAAMFALRDEVQDEDCLSLNVWAPVAPAAGAGRPVMVSLHGGGFKSGSGSARSAPWFDGSRLAERGDVVVVTVNHRIGVLGHLHPGGAPGSGNAGLLDLVAALEWVRDNVGAFGGDPARVTIFGESGGGGKVMALLTMRAAAGLFTRAICQSGTLEWLTPDEAAAVSAAVLGQLGVSETTGLRGVPVVELISAALAVTRGGMRFGPVLDGDVLDRPVAEALAGGAGAQVPLIIGVTRDEASAFLGPEDDLDQANLEPGLRARIAQRQPGDPSLTPWQALVAIRTDEMFREPALRAAAAKAAFGGAPAYVYEFAWETPVLGGALGAAHGVDVSFPFDNTDLHPATRGSGSARRLAPAVSDAWVAFARDGDPNHRALVAWPPYDPADGATLVFDDVTRLERRPVTS